MPPDVPRAAAKPIEHQDELGQLTWMEYRTLAHAHMVRDEYAEAARFLEKALASGTIQPEVIRQELRAVRSRLERAEAR